MRFWWVNQNQTWRHEIAGGYLWSPQRKSNGQVNPFYESMREVAPGDVVYSFRDTLIAAIGIAQSNCYECPKPLEFGNAGMNWDKVGWKVDVRFSDLLHKARPKDHMDALRKHLPQKYSPLSPGGDGSQSVYLAEIPEPLAVALNVIIGPEVQHTLAVADTLMREVSPAKSPAQDVVVWEEHLRDEISRNTSISTTEREAIVAWQCELLKNSASRIRHSAGREHH